MMEGGSVQLPRSAAWLDDYLHELCAFPTGKHDDQVDSTSQALHWIREQGSPGGAFEYYRQLFEKKVVRAQNRTVQLRAPQGASHVILRDGTTVNVGPDHTVWVAENDAGPLIGGGFVRLA